MLPKEVKERLSILAISAKATDTVIVAPLNVIESWKVIRLLNTEIMDCSFQRFDGQITAQDLIAFLNYVTEFEIQDEHSCL